jgi:hypothetical protein
MQIIEAQHDAAAVLEDPCDIPFPKAVKRTEPPEFQPREVRFVRKDGITDFSDLQAAMKTGKTAAPGI